MLRILTFSSLAMAVLLWAAAAQCQEDMGHGKGGSKRVVATGKAQVGGVAAEEEALRDALRKAVEQAAGQFITSVSATQDYELVHDEIFSEVKGFVETYKILRKFTQGDVLVVEIEAIVSVDAFRAGWEKLQSLINRWGKRRFWCVVSDKIDNREDQGHAAQGAIEKVFLDRGFPMVDKAQLEQLRERDLIEANLKGDLSKIAAVGRRFGAEVILVGEANAGEAEVQDVYGVRMFFYHPSVEIKAIRVDNALMIASESANVRKGSTNKMAAAKEALREAGTQVAKKIIDKVIKAMLKETMGQGGLLQIVVDEIGGRRNVNDLIKELKTIRGINGVFEREFGNNMLTLEVETTIPATELSDRLLEIKAVKLDVTATTPNRIDAKVIK